MRISDWSSDVCSSDLRKLWIAAGTVVSVIALWCLFRPPPQPSVIYYGFWFLMANIGWSLVEIPYRTWRLEFSPEPNARTRIVSWIDFASIIGRSLFFGVPPAGKEPGSLDNRVLELQEIGVPAVAVSWLVPRTAKD